MFLPTIFRVSCALLLALLAACTFDGQLASDYRCGTGRTCPNGSQCVVNRCAAQDDDLGDPDAGSDPGDPDASVGPGDPDAAVSPGDPDAAVSPGDPDAAPLAPDAAGARFADDFDDGVLTGWRPWTNPGCTVRETGGALQLDYQAGTRVYCGAETSTTFDLRTGAVALEVVETPAVAEFEAYVIMFSGDGQEILMIREAGILIMQLRIDGSVRGARTIADPGDRFWRVHLEGTSTIWETSADGGSWTTRHSTTVAVDASAMFVELAAGSYGGISNAARVRFDHVSVE